MLRLVAGRIVEASRVIWRRGVILWAALLPEERSFTSSSSRRVNDVVFSGKKVADGVKEVPTTTSLQRAVVCLRFALVVFSGKKVADGVKEGRC